MQFSQFFQVFLATGIICACRMSEPQRAGGFPGGPGHAFHGHPAGGCSRKAAQGPHRARPAPVPREHPGRYAHRSGPLLQSSWTQRRSGGDWIFLVFALNNHPQSNRMLRWSVYSRKQDPATDRAAPWNVRRGSGMMSSCPWAHVQGCI